MGLRSDLDNLEKRSRVVTGNFSVISIPTEVSQLHPRYGYEKEHFASRAGGESKFKAVK